MGIMKTGIEIKNIMTKRIVTSPHFETVQNIAKKMTEKRVGSIIITKKDRPVGIITETDINKRIVALAKDPKKLKAEDIMSTPIVHVKPGDDVSDVVHKMKKYKIRRFPVVKNGKIVGIITNTDIARISPEMIDVLNLRLKMRTGIPAVESGTTSGFCEECGNYSEILEFIDSVWVCVECKDSNI
ncbi:MAG: CBS domain-containing protein [Candidatus Aenigmarchaeota archaeon]|nr:CBS domain-containing protein [Candidatus Aenigmarchaeota archaeon]